MTAPKSNFYCATDSALMLEPVASGGGTIGTASYESQPMKRTSKAALPGIAKVKSINYAVEQYLQRRRTEGGFGSDRMVQKMMRIINPQVVVLLLAPAL